VQVSLLYNKNAVDTAQIQEVRDAAGRHGHEIVRVVERNAGLEALITSGADLIAVAGGDGTIAAAARRLAGCGIPLAILALGTANNIAKSLGCVEDIDESVSRWNARRRRRFDLGRARGPWGERRFVEAVGSGLIARGIAEMDTLFADDDRPTNATVANALQRYRDVLSRLKPQRCTLEIDGVQTNVDALLVEVLNIGSVGPNVTLTSDADPSDGVLTVVTAGEEHRMDLDRYLGDRHRGGDGVLCLPSRRGRHVVVDGPGDLHIDDEIILSTGPVSVHIEPAVLEVIV
jgi:diacylglycerol kinase family enzyme